MHRLSERFAHQNRFSPPPRFPQASTYPRIDRLASGLPPMTSGEHTLPLTSKRLRAIGFPTASKINFLTSPLIRTPRPVFQNGRYDTAYAFMPYQFGAVWFQALCTSRQRYFSAFTHVTTALSVSGRI